MKKLGLIILFVLLAFSCKNSIDNKNSKKGYGLINFTSTSRTVQADFDVESFENICLYGKNIGEGTDYILLKTWDVYDNFISDSLSIAVGSYEFYLTAKIENVGFKSDVVSVEIKESPIQTINFKVYVTDRGTGKGTVELNFTFGEPASSIPVSHGSFELNKITYENDTRKKSTVDLSDDALVVTPFNYDTEDAASAIFYAELDPGVYELISRFEVIYEEEPLGVAVYPVTIHVSEGQTSSDEIEVLNFNNYYSIEYTTRVGTDQTSELPNKYSIYDEVTIPNLTDEGYNKFQGWFNGEEKIEKISKYERTGNLTLSAKWHLDSQYMLFSKVEPSPTRGGYTSFVMTDNLSTDVEPSTDVEGEVIDFTIGGGNFYYYIANSEIKKSNVPDFNLSCYYTVDSMDEYVEKIYYDYKTDKLYGISSEINSICIIEDSISDTYSLDWNGYYPQISLIDFAIDEDKLYIVCLYDNMQTNGRRYEVNYFTKQTDNTTYQHKEIINIDTSPIPNDYFHINDMICMEGKVYILWNYKSYTSDGIYNYGGILCVDEQNECSQLLPYSTPENLPIITTTDPYDETEEVSVEYQGPSSTNYTSCLFGPKKFVAIKPKKLVIADEGLFVYADLDGNGTADAENVNRVVTIDLDNLSTPFVSQNVSVLFDENSPENTTVTFCCAYELDIKKPSIITSVQ